LLTECHYGRVGQYEIWLYWHYIQYWILGVPYQKFPFLAPKLPRMNERNIFGIGHQFDYKFTNRLSDKNANNLVYTIPNIRNSCNDSTKIPHKLRQLLRKKLSSLIVLLFPSSKMGCGISLGQEFRKTLYKDWLEICIPKFQIQFTWFLGWKAVQILKGNSINAKTTNLILSDGFKYWLSRKSIPTVRSHQLYSSEQFILSGIGITT
jgi:hypothetical protein